MSVSAMQPYLFPYVGLFQLIRATDVFVVLDNVNFIKRGWINRNRILVNGQVHTFSVPLVDASQNRLINETRIVDQASWSAKFLTTLETAYKRAPFFHETMDLVSSVVGVRADTIDQLAERSVAATCAHLGITTKFARASVAFPTVIGKGQDRIIGICRALQETHYVNPIGGIELYSGELFAAQGIRLNFLPPRIVPYAQFSAPFEPGLSIIDVLMFNGRQRASELVEPGDMLDPEQVQLNSG